MNTSTIPRRSKRPLSTISCPSSPSSSEHERRHKKLALSLHRLSLSSSPNPEPESHEVEMRQRKSYEKDAFTTVIESLSTSTSDNDERVVDKGSDSDAPFPRDEAHVTILSEIEKRLTKLPHTLLTPSTPDTALVLYRSPESMGLPKSERQRLEEMKMNTRKRILEKRRLAAQMQTREARDLDGYEADAEDWDDVPKRNHSVNGFQRHDMIDDDNVDDCDDDEGDMMDLD
jgi:hypothetical protein